MTQPVASSVTRPASEAVDTITLDETARHRRRVAMISDGGISFLLDLPDARLLRHGDGLELDDGRIIEVCASPEPLYRVLASSRQHLLKLAWHLGNRHCPSQIFEGHIFIRRDPVLKSMLEGLGALVVEIEAPFDPEGGAYGDLHAHSDHATPHHHHG